MSEPLSTPPTLAEDPIARFHQLFALARSREPMEGTAAALATADAAGRPSVRMVLVKEADERGFRFYTNLGSRKVRELDDNPWASLCFHWPTIGEQVRVEGPVEPLADADADTYFASRPRDSQIGAWASRQSEPLSSRAELEARIAAVEARYSGQPVPRPPFWGGFRLLPDEIEFWTNRDFRLHDRLRYRRDAEGGDWRVERLFP